MVGNSGELRRVPVNHATVGSKNTDNAFENWLAAFEVWLVKLSTFVCRTADRLPGICSGRRRGREGAAVARRAQPGNFRKMRTLFESVQKTHELAASLLLTRGRLLRPAALTSGLTRFHMRAMPLFGEKKTTTVLCCNQ